MLLPELADTFWQPLSTRHVAANAEGFTPSDVAASLAAVPQERDVITSSAVLLPAAVASPLPDPRRSIRSPSSTLSPGLA